METPIAMTSLIETPADDLIIRHATTFFREHAEDHFKESIFTCHKWKVPPARPMPPEWNSLFVLEIKNFAETVYLTSGAWRLTSGHPRFEFLICAPGPDPTHVGTLTALASFQQDPDFPLDIGHQLKIGKPWLPGSACDRLLLSLPYPFGPKLEWTGFDDVCIRIVWALPITPQEAEFARTHSAEELEQRFDKAKINYRDPYRKSVV